MTACSSSDHLSREKITLEKEYTNTAYDISLRVPNQWSIVESSELKVGTYALNIFKKGSSTEKKLPLGVHAGMKHSYLSFWPHGYGTELPFGQHVSFRKVDPAKVPDLKFAVNEKESELLLLKDGSVWGYFIAPENPPESWEPYGFIYAQVRTANASATCYDRKSGQKKSMKACNFLAGDRYIRQGDIDKRDAAVVRQILESITFDRMNEQSRTALIEIKKPSPNTTVTSPLTVKGKARGTWYFEGVFAVELYDAQGNLLAQKTATAQDNWMINDYVPFKATLTFNTPGTTHGKLVLKKANPSGLKKHRKAYSIPITFSKD